MNSYAGYCHRSVQLRYTLNYTYPRVPLEYP